MIYKISAIDILLDKDVILSRYYPLISYKTLLVSSLEKNNILTNYDCLKDNVNNILLEYLGSNELVNLFKRFLVMYEVDESKLNIINKLDLSIDEKESYKELFLLPGVKETRARLYYLSGYKSLSDISTSSVEDISNNMKLAIEKYNLDYLVALPKEIKTHIAVAKAYTNYHI